MAAVSFLCFWLDTFSFFAVVLSRVQDFLPKLALANEVLLTRPAAEVSIDEDVDAEHDGPMIEMVRDTDRGMTGWLVLDWRSKGRGFESRQEHKKKTL